MEREKEENMEMKSECGEGISAWEQPDLDLYLMTPPEQLEPLTEGENGLSEDMLAATLYCDPSDPSQSRPESSSFSDVNHKKLLSRFSLDYFDQPLQMAAEEGNEWIHLLPPPLQNMACAKKSALLDVEKASFEDTLGGDQPLDRPREHLPRALLKRAFFVKRPEEPLLMPHYNFGNPATIQKPAGIKQKYIPLPSMSVKLPKRPRTLNEDIPIDELQELLGRINAKLSKNKFGRGRNPFLEVITRGNCASKGIPEYFNFVSDPMNMKWTKGKISCGGYTNVTDYMADIELIAANAQKFNRPGEVTYTAASTLRKALVKELKRAGFITENVETENDTTNAQAVDGEPEEKKRKLERNPTYI